MVKLGRNDICMCGSKKKYKKCCGKNKVISVGHIVEKDLEEVQKEIIQYAVTNYDDFIDDYLKEYHEELVLPEEAADVFRFFATLFIISTVEMENGKTILIEYIDRHRHKQKRQQTKEIITSWTKATPSISIVEDKDENNYLTIRNFFTEERMTVLVPEDQEVSIGGLLLNIMLPYGNLKSIAFSIGLDLKSDKTEKMTTKIFHLFEESGLDQSEFCTAYFIELINLFIFGEMEINVSDIEWQSDAQFEVAQLLEEEIPKYFDADEIKSLAIVLWKQYCDKKNPRIQKPILYVAALIYLLDKISPFGWGLTQAILADNFNISSSSISNKYNELVRVLKKDIEELETLLYDFEDDDYFEDDEPFAVDPDQLFQSKMFLEKEMGKVTKAMQEQDFNTFEEAMEFLNRHLGDDGYIPRKTDFSDKEKAQELLYEAFEAKGIKRKRLAQKALKLYPNSPDAYLILSETEDDPIETLKAGVAAGELDLGKKFFKENKGHFWLIHETRPYMRVKYQLAFYLHDFGYTEEAIKDYQDLLELNPNDNQGVRYDLFIAYIDVDRLEDVEALLQKYNETYTTSHAYNIVLLEFLKNGATNKAKQLLKKAKKQNPFVLDYLLGKKQLPLHEPVGFHPGDENDAIIYVEKYCPIWFDSKERIEWLK